MASEKQSTRKSSRLLWGVLAGLLVVGLPALSWGLQLGDAHRAGVLELEARFLGMPLPRAAGAPNAPQAQAPIAPPPVAPRPVAPPPPPAPAAPSAAPGPGEVPPGAAELPAPSPSPVSPQATAPEPPSVPPATGPVPPSAAEAAAAGNASAASVRVSVKVLVDERWVAARPQWLVGVQRTIALASRAYQNRTGIQLALTGVVRWPTALEGLGASAMHDDLRHRPREGADVLLGFLGVALPPDALQLGAPAPESSLNGAYALVGVSPGASDAHLHDVLRAIGVLLGAHPVIAGDGTGHTLGSWMAEGALRTPDAPWLDLDNLERIHARRGLPFEAPPQ